MQKHKNSLYLRNFVFGIEDSLVSTVGLLAGIASQHIPTATVLLTGIIYIFVEGFSMAVGSFLSEESAEEYEKKSAVSNRIPVWGAVVMFISFIIAGFIPIAPYLLFSGESGVYASIAISLFVLFIIGFINACISHVKPFRRAVRMVILGGLAIIVGVLVGKFAQIG